MKWTTLGLFNAGYAGTSGPEVTEFVVRLKPRPVLCCTMHEALSRVRLERRQLSEIRKE
jgi:hypothetical protein